MLDMRHIRDIDAIAAGQRSGQAQGTILRSAMNDSRGIALAREHGYDVVGISSGFEQVGLREADRFVDTGQLNEFEVQALILSGLGSVLRMVAPEAISQQWNDRIDATFDAIASIGGEASDRPRLIVGHVPSPHAPWVDDANGRLRVLDEDATIFQETPESTELDDAALKKAFVDQVEYVQGRTVDLLDRLEAEVTRPSVIVLFSDHGPAYPMERLGPEWRFHSLLAAKALDGSKLFADDQTLVNVLPRLWNTYLGTSLPMADDTSYLWTDPSDLLALEPVEDAE